jgi:hypothetical protein
MRVNKMSNIVPLADIQAMAEVAAGSRMFGFKNPQEAMAIMLLCQAEDLHPAIAMRDYHVIQGRPALKADAMLARFQQAGGAVQWKEYTDEKVTGLFSHPAGGSLEVTWTLNKAKLIGIANKDNWKNYSRAMLRARCVSEGIRSVYPGCVVGVYTPEEVQDFAPVPVERARPEPVQEVEIIKSIEEQTQDAQYKLWVPNLEEPHSAYETVEEWIAAYAGLVKRIVDSAKLKVQDKTQKIESLSVVNDITTVQFNTFERIKLKAAIANAGADPQTHIPSEFTTVEL